MAGFSISELEERRKWLAAEVEGIRRRSARGGVTVPEGPSYAALDPLSPTDGKLHGTGSDAKALSFEEASAVHIPFARGGINGIHSQSSPVRSRHSSPQPKYTRYGGSYSLPAAVDHRSLSSSQQFATRRPSTPGRSGYRTPRSMSSNLLNGSKSFGGYGSSLQAATPSRADGECSSSTFDVNKSLSSFISPQSHVDLVAHAKAVGRETALAIERAKASLDQSWSSRREERASSQDFMRRKPFAEVDGNSMMASHAVQDATRLSSRSGYSLRSPYQGQVYPPSPGEAGKDFTSSQLSASYTLPRSAGATSSPIRQRLGYWPERKIGQHSL